MYRKSNFTKSRLVMTNRQCATLQEEYLEERNSMVPCIGLHLMYCLYLRKKQYQGIR